MKQLNIVKTEIQSKKTIFFYPEDRHKVWEQALKQLGHLVKPIRPEDKLSMEETVYLNNLEKQPNESEVYLPLDFDCDTAIKIIESDNPRQFITTLEPVPSSDTKQKELLVFDGKKEPINVESNTNSSEEKSKLKEVEDFFKQHKTPELKEILLEQTQGFVEQILERRLKYNLLTQDVELDGTSLRRHQNETLDVVNRMLVVCEKEYQVKFQNKKQFRNHLMDVLSRNTYHPVEKYLTSLEHSVHKNSLDSTTPVSIDNLAERYLGNKDELANILLKKALIAAVARALNPGCKADAILILYSAQQGIGKSSFLRALAKKPEWFNDTVPKLNLSKDFYSKLHQNWFTEIGEIDTKFGRIKQEEIKDFITSSTDQFRPAYTATMLTCDRRFVLTGSTNNANFLDDPTGSRRYWIVRVNRKIDIPCLEKEVDGIWAAAVDAYNKGEPWHLNEEEEKMLEESNAAYTYEHPWYRTIKLYLDCHELDEYILPEKIAEIPTLDIPRREINKPNSKALKDIRNLLQQKFGYYRKKISHKQREKLFDKLSKDRRCQPQVLDISEIPHSIWVKSDDFCVEDFNQRQSNESKAA